MIYSGRYRVTSPYGMRLLNGTQEFHSGIDVVGVKAKYVCAVASGYVAASQIITDKTNLTWQWGNYVCVIGDDGKQYYYCHMSKRLVEKGKRVNKGDHLGIEGNTGYSFGAHCHFEVRDANGTTLNPAPFLGIPNAVGEYGVDYRTTYQRYFKVDNGTMNWIDGYKYADDFYRKMVEAIEKLL